MFPPGFTLGKGHLLGVTTRCLGLTLRGMKIEVVHQPGAELDTDEKDGGLCTYKSDSLHGGRACIDFELGVNTSFNTIIAELITLRRNNKVVFNMVYAC